MHDRVADILAQRAALDRGAGVAIAISVFLHAALTGLAVWAALHASPIRPAGMVKIQFASVKRPHGATAEPAAVQRPKPKIAEPAPRIEEPRPVVEKKAAKPEKGTVPFSPFGRSTKKGSEAPASEPPRPVAGGTTTTADVPVGGAGVTGLEGGDFPYTLYIEGMQRRIGSNWFRPQVTTGPVAVVYFRIQRNGVISEARVEIPSGNAAFDRAALSAVRSSSPLTPLPYGYAGTWLGVHLTFR